MIPSLEVVFASIAVLLGILSITTHRSVRHLGVGRSFWIPVFVSSVFFFIGSAVTILYEMGFLLIPQTPIPLDAVQVSQVSRILALCILFIGIFSYSRRVRTILTQETPIPKQITKEKIKIQAAPVEDSQKMEVPIQERLIREDRIQDSSKEESASKCKHQFGYLRTLPRDIPIPDECLSCDRIIECKHSLVKKLESPFNR